MERVKSRREEAQLLLGPRDPRERVGYFPTNQLNVIQGRFYDSLSIGSGTHVRTGQCSVFQNVGVQSGKSRSDSNMDIPGKLNPPDAFLIERVVFKFASFCQVSDVSRFIESAVFHFEICSRIYFTTPLISVPPLGISQMKAPLKCCESCGSCFVGLKCESCGAPEWRYLGYGGNPSGDKYNEFDSDLGYSLVLDVSASKVNFNWQHQIRGAFDIGPSGFITSPVSKNGEGMPSFKFWTVLEGWHGRGIA